MATDQPHNAANREPAESPLHLAKRLGLLSLRHKTGYETVTLDGLLELAAVAYWRNRPTHVREVA